MDQEPDLEGRLSENGSQAASNQGLLGKISYHSKYFVVDGIAYAAFYAPIMAVTERVSGLEWNEIETTRTIGAVTGFASAYAISLLTKWWGKSIGANTNAKNGTKKKRIVDTAVGIITTMPSYAPILYVAGASAKEMMLALVLGPVTAAAAGLVYRPVADWWRKKCGLEPVFYK